MITKELIDKYEPTIGIECHVQLKTKTKLFAAVSNDAREADPNELVTPICYGMPGMLPVLNESAVEHSIRAGLALNATIEPFSKFDRKHYFYPDLPKGYQITQFDQPIITEGFVEIKLGDKSKKVGIERAHIEEDAGKLTHPAGKDYSLVDLNRAGTPLLEIVSKPEMHSAEEARAYAQELYLLMKYSEASDVDLYHGNMRFDVNVSVAEKGSNQLGTRTETKNLNSFKSIEKAIEFEIKRQIEEVEKGNDIVQETRGWDDAKLKTFSQRSKEESHDYRYFPEPDLPPIEITPDQIEAIRKTMNLLPSQIRAKLKEVGLSDSVIEVLLGYPTMISKITDILDEDKATVKKIADWLVNVVPSIAQTNKNIDLEDAKSFLPNVSALIKLSKLVEEGTISSSSAKQILESKINDLEDPEAVATELNLIQDSDDHSLEEIIKAVFAENPKAVDDIKAGEMKAIGFIIGNVMKKSGGSANPQKVKELIVRLTK